jgi:uncharacterized protein
MNVVIEGPDGDEATAATLGGLLRALRLEAGVTQVELAARAGTTQSAVSQYETGQLVPELGTIARLAAAAGFEVELRVRPDSPTPATASR